MKENKSSCQVSVKYCSILTTCSIYIYKTTVIFKLTKAYDKVPREVL